MNNMVIQLIHDKPHTDDQIHEILVGFGFNVSKYYTYQLMSSLAKKKKVHFGWVKGPREHERLFSIKQPVVR